MAYFNQNVDLPAWKTAWKPRDRRLLSGSDNQGIATAKSQSSSDQEQELANKHAGPRWRMCLRDQCLASWRRFRTILLTEMNNNLILATYISSLALDKCST